MVENHALASNCILTVSGTVSTHTSTQRFVEWAIYSCIIFITEYSNALKNLSDFYQFFTSLISFW